MTQKISIPRTLANRLLTLAQLTPTLEICGLIATDANKKHHIYPIDNVADAPQHNFEMHPQQQITAFKSIREKQQTLFAIYHSHPDGEAKPSTKDINDSAYHHALNIIISLSTEGVLDMRGYFYQNGDAQVIDLIIE